MPEYWRKLLGPYLAEADDGTNGGAAGGSGAGGAGGGESAGGAPGGDGQKPGDSGAGGTAAQPGNDEPVEVGMLAAIQAGLAGEAEKQGAGKPAPGSTSGAAAAGTAKPNATGTQPAGEAGAAQPKLGPDGKPLADAAGGAGEAKPKKADDFALKPEEQKAFTPNAQQRIREMHKAWKETETQYSTQAAALQRQNEQLAQARDSIVSVLEETQTSPEDLTQLLSFNQLIKTGKLDDALKVVDQYRARLLTVLGKEAPGVDLLADFPDLKARVEKTELSREDALELAKGRRDTAARQQQQQQQGRQQQTEQQVVETRNDALGKIETWSKKMATEDIDYKEKERTILAAKGGDGLTKLEAIIRTYPPNLWLQRFQEEYDAIVIRKPGGQGEQQGNAEVPGTGGDTPLRASGAKGGQRAPKTEYEAIAQGLGYTNLN